MESLECPTQCFGFSGVTVSFGSVVGSLFVESLELGPVCCDLSSVLSLGRFLSHFLLCL